MSMVQAGVISLGSGVSTYTATGLALPFTPASIDVKIRKPAAADLNLLGFVYGTPTADGFSVELSGTTDKTGYILEWTAWASVVSVSGDSLATTYSDLTDAVRLFLGYPSTMAVAQAAEVDRHVQSGVRQFYYPPTAQGIEAGYEWSFLRPSTTITTADGDGAMDMPVDFGRLVGDMNFAPDLFLNPVAIVSEAKIQALLQESTDESAPKYAAIRFKTNEFGAHGQRQEIVFWPIPDTAYVLTYRYEAFAGKLSALNPYPLGGMKHSELVTESCLAVAEQRSNDENGLHTERFYSLLATAIAQDRRNGAKNFGPMGGTFTVTGGMDSCRTRNGDVTYKGSTW